MRRVLSPSRSLCAAERVRPACPQPRLQASLPDCVPERALGAAALVIPRRRAASTTDNTGQEFDRELREAALIYDPRSRSARRRMNTDHSRIRQPRGGMYLADCVLGVPAPKYFNPPPTHGVRSAELQKAIANLRRICVQPPGRSTYKGEEYPVTSSSLLQPAGETKVSSSEQELTPESQLKEVIKSLRPVSRSTRRPIAMCGSHQIGHQHYTWIARKCPDSN